MSAALAVDSLDGFLFGHAPRPLRCGHGVEIGAGRVVPEINFTLPPLEVSAANWPEVRRQYEGMIESVLTRAAHLGVPSLLVEFETLPPMTTNPEWGLEITGILAEKCRDFHEKHGLGVALRATPNDIREFNRPPLLRQGRYWERMIRFFEKAGSAGADLLAIESTGGKEICDPALVNADLRQVVFALGVLGARDMRFLWEEMVRHCHKSGIVPSGDTACGFANTAMTLADQGMIPKVFAAMVRVISVPRSLVAYEAGAVGPGKDCGYEGPYMKAIAGVPISMEGRSAACAHFSPLGNIAQAVCDCWSNESVANVRLLSGHAPEVSMEQLAYDCRLTNTALAESADSARRLRDLLADSDSFHDPQAYILRPDVVLDIARDIMEEETPYGRTCRAARKTWAVLREAGASGRLSLSPRELRWLERLGPVVDDLPASEEEMLETMASEIPKDAYLPEEYGLSG